MNLIYIWLAIWILFLIVEMSTVMLYWLSISISAFIMAVYVYSIWAKEFDMPQLLIFCVLSIAFVFTFPKFFHLTWPTSKVWVDVQIWKTFKLKKVWDDWKISIDWVDYLIDDACITEDFSIWKQVTFVSSSSWVIKVELN